MNRMDDPLKVVTDLRSAVLDQLIEHGYAQRRDADLARAAADRTTHRPAARGRESRGRPVRPRWYLVTGSIAVAAAAVTVAVLNGAPPASGRRPASSASPARTAPPAHAAPAEFTTARQVLLDAAAHVTRVPATGKYWRVQVISGEIWPGGTKAHPYDISVTNSETEWNPRSAGQTAWDISQGLGAAPATLADAAAWRAGGSPAAWRGGEQRPQYDVVPYPGAGGAPRPGELNATTARSTPSGTWIASDGIVRFIEGDLPGLTAAQFRQMPATSAGVRAVLRHYAEMTSCIQHHSSGCATEDQLVWGEALALLQDPVSAPVRSATFKVMAALPGVRMLGPMTDPLGRHGYGLDGGSDVPSQGVGYHPVSAVVIDPSTARSWPPRTSPRCRATWPARPWPTAGALPRGSRSPRFTCLTG